MDETCMSLSLNAISTGGTAATLNWWPKTEARWFGVLPSGGFESPAAQPPPWLQPWEFAGRFGPV
ncbi:MAG: hypothetical protein JXB13_08920 [Phycisphaerae bacterium]|nr:hypothetical protein [Phycisphaerae bacterium]